MQSRVVYLMGENELLLEGLRRILIEASFCDAATITRIDDMVPVVLGEERPVVLIISLGENHATILDRVQQLKKQQPTVRVFLLADHNQLDDDKIVAAFRSGVNGYCLKPTCENLLRSLELVMDGEAILPATTLSHLLRKDGFLVTCEVDKPAPAHLAPIAVEPQAIHSPRLSGQEQCILRCLIEGDSNKVIARKHDITEATVKVHVKAILRKIRLNNRTQAAIWGIHNSAFMNAPPKSVERPTVRLLSP